MPQRPARLTSTSGKRATSSCGTIAPPCIAAGRGPATRRATWCAPRSRRRRPTASKPCGRRNCRRRNNGEFFQVHAHLVGSIGLDTVDEVYRTVGEMLGPYLRRVPDGEVGGRKLWISWQYPLLRASVFLRPDPSGAIRPTNRFPLLTLAEGVTPSDVRFGELGYAREARASYLDFVAARDNGTLPKGIRFQVCLPTPFAVVSSVVVPAVLPAVEAAYEKAMIAEVAALLPPHSASRSRHPVGRLQRDGGVGRPGQRRRAGECAARGVDRAHAAALRRGARRRRAWSASLLRRFRRQAFRRAEGRGQDGRVRQCA